MALLGVWQLVRFEKSSSPSVGAEKERSSKEEEKKKKKRRRKDWYLERKVEWGKDKLEDPPTPTQIR